MGRVRMLLTGLALVLAACASEQAASDPAADQSLASASLFTEQDLGSSWTVQPSDPLADALLTCIGPESIGAPNARVPSRRYTTPLGVSVVGTIEMWPSSGAANNAIGSSVTDAFNLCLRTAYEAAIAAGGLTQVDRRAIGDPAPQRGDGSIRNTTIFTVQDASGARRELQADVVRVRRGRIVVTTVVTGPESADATSEVQQALDAMLNRTAS